MEKEQGDVVNAEDGGLRSRSAARQDNQPCVEVGMLGFRVSGSGKTGGKGETVVEHFPPLNR